MNAPEMKDAIKKDEEKIIEEFEKRKKEIISEIDKYYRDMKKEYEHEIDKLKSSLDNLQEKLIFYSVINDDVISLLFLYSFLVEDILN